MADTTSMSDDANLRTKLEKPNILNPPQANTPTAASTVSEVLTRPILKPVQSSQPHGYGDIGAETHPHLHPHRASAQAAPAPDMMPRGPSPPSDEAGGAPGSSPAAKRELSQSKRAAQNRAAQRAFRQRKEHYIKKLEQQVRDFGELEHSFKVIQNDNYALRQYVIDLQSRLIELHADLPQPPPNVNISPPAAVVPATGVMKAAHPAAAAAESNGPAPSSSSAGTLADVAAAVAGLKQANEGFYSKPNYKQEAAEEAHTAEQISRQLQQEPLPPPSSLRA
ncbi:hypothetical protein F4778DRAFT_793120 [Xylariomycetidae sp. FL2044]|nr:hypothetical protein F4778DRAFT_793120 [Xylariomycetidae sp. FL2044]